jgi:hypothetical protein
MLCGVLFFAFAVAAKDEGPNSSDPSTIVDWFIARDSEFFTLRKQPAASQKKVRDELLGDLTGLANATAVEGYVKKQNVLLNWVSQYITHQNYTKKGKYSPAETAHVQKMAAELQAIPSKAQLLQAGYEVSEETEALLAGKAKVASYYLKKKYDVKVKPPTPEDEAAVRATLDLKK